MPPPTCGDGIITPAPEDPARHETCDEGFETGGATSLCTLQCRDARVRWEELPGTTVLPFPARKMVHGLPDHLVISAFDDNGIAIVPVANSGGTQILKKYSAPMAFEVGKWDQSDTLMEVMWIERAIEGVGGPYLLFAKIGEEPAVIREVAYPLMGSVGGKFASIENIGPNGFVDVLQDGTIQRVWTYGLSMSSNNLGPTPGGTLSFALRFYTVDATARIRLATFFADGSATGIVLASDPNGGPSTRDWEYVWNKSVLDAVHGSWTRQQGVNQVALLSTDGTVDILSLGSTPAEILDSAYGALPAGSQHITSLGGADPSLDIPRYSLLTVDAQGRIVVLKNNGAGRSLAPQYLPIGPSCSVCTIAEHAGANPEWFALDTLAVRGTVLAATD